MGAVCSNPLQSNSHYTHGTTRKRVTSGEIHLRAIAPGQRSNGELMAKLRATRPERCV